MQVSDQIIQVLNALCEKFGIVVDWTAVNIIPYLTELCHRICRYEIATSIVWLVCGTGVIIGSIWYYKRSWKKEIDWGGCEIKKEEVHGILSVVFLVLGLLLGTIIVLCQIFDIIQACCLPEVIIIEYLKNLQMIIQ